MWGFFGRYPKGSALELLDGTLKLRHCTNLFTMRFPRGLYPRLEMEVGRGSLFISWMRVVRWVKVRLTRKTRPGASSHDIPDPGHPTPRRWKRLRSPLPPKEWGVRSASLAIFSSPWVWVIFCTWGRLKPALGGNRRRGYRLVSPAEGVSALALVRFY